MITKKRIFPFLTLIAVLFFSCQEKELIPIPFEKIANGDVIPDGKYPGYIYFLNSKNDTLNKLSCHSNVWIVVSNDTVESIDFGKQYVPGRKSTNPEVIEYFKEFDQAIAFQIKGCKFDPWPFNLKVENEQEYE